MRIILFLLCFINYAYSTCAPGPVPCETAGVEAFKVQTVDPTFTASPGEKGLFNTNSQFKTKGEFGNIQRLVKGSRNLLSIGNGGMEEGLTGYAGIGTLNILTPLQGLKSINLDTTAQNDFMETALVTLPPILFGNTCMARINIRGGDANLQFQVVNGAGTIIHSGQFASAFTDSTPQHLVFQCPTQAEVTATPALGQLKIKIVQSTATNAALATLDMFYLGELDAQTMAVTEGVEELQADTSTWATTSGGNLDWSNISKNTISNLGTLVINNAARFPYTAKKSQVISISCSAYRSSLTHPSWANTEILKNGVSISINEMGDSDVGGSIQRLAPLASATLELSTGDIITCRYSGSNAIGVGEVKPKIVLTATPLSQIATVVPTTQTRAGFYARRTWTSGSWSRTSNNSFANFTPVAATAGTPEGFAITDAATDGQLPRLTISILKKGRYRASFVGAFQTNTAAGYCMGRFAISNSTGAVAAGGHGMTGTALGYSNSITQILNVSSDTANATLDLQLTGWTGNSTCSLSPTQSPMEISLEYLPDLSDSTEGITVNKMLPIVQGSETVVEEWQANGLNSAGVGTRYRMNNVTKNTINETGTITNDAGSRFSFTAKKKVLISIGCVYFSTTSGTSGTSITINGTTKTRALGLPPAGSGESIQPSITATMDAGDALTCIQDYPAAGASLDYIVLSATSFGKPGVITSDAVVTNSGATTARKWRTESCLINNPAGTASLGSPECNNWVQSASRTGAGVTTITFLPNIFSGVPLCSCTGSRTGAVDPLCYRNAAVAPTSTETRFITINSTGTAVDQGYIINCQGTE